MIHKTTSIYRLLLQELFFSNTYDAYGYHESFQVENENQKAESDSNCKTKSFFLYIMCEYLPMLYEATAYCLSQTKFYICVVLVMPNVYQSEAEALKEHIPIPILLWWYKFTGEHTERICGDVKCFVTNDRHLFNHPSTKVIFLADRFRQNDVIF